MPLPSMTRPLPEMIGSPLRGCYRESKMISIVIETLSARCHVLGSCRCDPSVSPRDPSVGHALVLQPLRTRASWHLLAWCLTFDPVSSYLSSLIPVRSRVRPSTAGSGAVKAWPGHSLFRQPGIGKGKKFPPFPRLPQIGSCQPQLAKILTVHRRRPPLRESAYTGDVDESARCHDRGGSKRPCAPPSPG